MFFVKPRVCGRDGADVRARDACDREDEVVAPECSSLVILTPYSATGNCRYGKTS